MSVSKLMSIHPFNIVVSVGYDKKVCVWKLPVDSPLTSLDDSSFRRSTSRSMQSRSNLISVPTKPSDLLLGHTEPVLDCAVVNMTGDGQTNTDSQGSVAVATACTVVTGDRAGTLRVWDLCTGRFVVSYSQAQGSHRGSVTALTSACSMLQQRYASGSSNVDLSAVSHNQYFMSGGADGYVSVWDVRMGSKPACNIPVHVSSEQRATTSEPLKTSGRSTIVHPQVSSTYPRRDLLSASLVESVSSVKRSLKPSRLVASQAIDSLSSAMSRCTSLTPSNSATLLHLNKVSGAPVTCLSVATPSPGAELQYLLSGSADGRLVLLDLRYGSTNTNTNTNMNTGNSSHSSHSSHIVAEYNKHVNGVHSLHIVDESVAYSGDGSGMLYCHQLNIASSSSGSDNGIETRFGLGASSSGAVKCIHHMHALEGKKGTLVAAGDDGKAILYDYLK